MFLTNELDYQSMLAHETFWTIEMKMANEHPVVDVHSCLQFQWITPSLLKLNHYLLRLMIISTLMICLFFSDVIFFIYVYQRYIYKIDPKRVNEYGTSQDMFDQNAEVKTEDQAAIEAGSATEGETPAIEKPATDSTATENPATDSTPTDSIVTDSTATEPKPAEEKKND